MERSSITLTVLFDAPFWMGVFERVENGQLTVAKITFGAEPKDYEVHDFVLKHFCNLKFSPAVVAKEHHASDNPKRRQRAARKQMQEAGIGTRSQQALQLQLEAAKTEHKQASREQREAEKQRQFDLKQQKRKEKRRGH